MRGSDFVFDWVQLMHFKCHKVTSKRGRSYIDSPAWLKNKRSDKKLGNWNNKCFQYAATVALNYLETETHSERVLNIAAFIKKYNWNEIKYPSKLKNIWKK